jgi:hypothetical protein
VLRQVTKNEIIEELFPLSLRIYLVPKLNILTVEFNSKKYGSDKILGGLFMSDTGRSVVVKEMETILMTSNERCY